MSEWILSETPGYVRLAPRAEGFTPIAAFSTRPGGTSAAPFDTLNLSEGVGDDPRAVRENRRRLLAALGLEQARVAYVRQVHGAACRLPVGPGDAGEGDALAVFEPGLSLAVGVADCLPVLLWDRHGRGVAAAHAGWRGTLAGVVRAALEALASRGIGAPDLGAALGPRICPCCFVVGPEVLELFPSSDRTETPAGTTVNLAQAVTRQLLDAGVPRSRVQDLGWCTACAPERLFSHRRDRGRTGRHWGVVALHPARERAAFEPAV